MMDQVISETSKQLLPPNFAEKLDQASSVDEVRQLLMNMVAQKEIIFPSPPKPEAQPEKMKQEIQQLRLEYQDIQPAKIGRSDAARDYNISRTTLMNWEKQELEPGSPIVQVFEKGFGRGQQVMLNHCHVRAMVEFTKKYRTTGKKSGPVPGFYKYKRSKKLPISA